MSLVAALFLANSAFAANVSRPAEIRFVYWSPTIPGQDWARLRAELAHADAAVILAGPQALATLNGVAQGTLAPAQAKAALKGPAGHDRFTSELVDSVGSAGVMVVSPDTAQDEAALQEALTRHADALRAGDEDAALRALADAHALQGNSLLAFLKSWAKPGERLVVLQRLPYTQESTALVKEGQMKVSRIFLPKLPIRFDARDAAERRLLKKP